MRERQLEDVEVTEITDFTIGKVVDRNFHKRSEVAQEIISRRPDFVERWALQLFMAILLLLIGATWFVRYPDIIRSRATLSANNGAKELIPLQTGRLIKLFVHNGQQVKMGEMIGWIESTANTQEVLQLLTLLDSTTMLLYNDKPEMVSSIFQKRFLNLGELQSSYQVCVIALQQFNDYHVNGFYERQKGRLLSDINAIGEMNSALEKQRQLTLRDNELSQQSFNMNETLFKEKVISAEEYREVQSKLVNKQMAIPQINNNILSNQNQHRDKLKELEQLNHDLSQQKINFLQALQTLKSNVEDWIRKYTIRAPLDGSISFAMSLQENQFIQAGRLLGYVNPPDSKYYVELYLPQNNLGKVETGMQVQLRFDAYPYQEQGIVLGRLDYISKVASDSGYLATIKLDQGLQTNTGKFIHYKGGLKADALVITKDMRLLQRLYYNIVKTASVNN